MDDKKIIENIRAGDERAFEELFRNYYALLCGYANQLLQDRDLTEELVQDFFCHLWDKRAELAITDSLKAYLFRAVRNRCYNHFRHLKVREVHREEVMARNEDSNDDGHDVLTALELDQKIQLVVDALPEQCKRVFLMSRYEDMKYQEIADTLKISKKAVEAHISKALKTLREELKEYFPFILWWFWISF